MFELMTIIRKRPEVSTEEFRVFMEHEYGPTYVAMPQTRSHTHYYLDDLTTDGRARLESSKAEGQVGREIGREQPQEGRGQAHKIAGRASDGPRRHLQCERCQCRLQVLLAWL
jgi:hypothetical protein